MGSGTWRGIAAFASILAWGSAAVAADLAMNAPSSPFIPSTWGGFYLGIDGGGGWSDTQFQFVTAHNNRPSGGVVGSHVGYNWQRGSVVTGLEADFNGADISSTDGFGFKTKTDALASARGRLGVAAVPNLLAYGTAGFGWGHTEISGWTDPNKLPGDHLENQFGWVAGAGLEYKLWGPLIARAEYLHYDFMKQTFPQDNIKEKVDVVRGGLSYKF